MSISESTGSAYSLHWPEAKDKEKSSTSAWTSEDLVNSSQNLSWQRSNQWQPTAVSRDITVFKVLEWGAKGGGHSAASGGQGREVSLSCQRLIFFPLPCCLCAVTRWLIQVFYSYLEAQSIQTKRGLCQSFWLGLHIPGPDGGQAFYGQRQSTYLSPVLRRVCTFSQTVKVTVWHVKVLNVKAIFYI